MSGLVVDDISSGHRKVSKKKYTYLPKPKRPHTLTH